MSGLPNKKQWLEYAERNGLDFDRTPTEVSESFTSALVEVLHELVTERGLTIRGFSEAANISKDTLCALFRGKVKNPTIQVFVRAAAALAIEPSELFTLAETRVRERGGPSVSASIPEASTTGSGRTSPPEASSQNT